MTSILFKTLMQDFWSFPGRASLGGGMLKSLILILVSVLLTNCASTSKTQWHVKGSEGLDAVLFVGALSGDKLQADQYPDEIKHYRALLTDTEIIALERIQTYYAQPGKGLVGPAVAYHLADASDQSYEGLLDILKDPAPFYKIFDIELDTDQLERLHDFRLVYAALQRIGFIDHWRADVKPVVERGVKGFEDYLAPFDIIPLHEKYLGRDLDNRIDVVLLNYNRPYGIRVYGQRFATFHGWSKAATLQTAAHEIFHPPFDSENPALIEAAEALKESRLFQNIVSTVDPAFGYSTFESILDEDSTQALDKLVIKALGEAFDPKVYWRAQDDGMHILAAAIYDAMIETGFAQTGGVYEDWLIFALNSEVLSPETVERRARKVIGDDAVEKWLPKSP